VRTHPVTGAFAAGALIVLAACGTSTSTSPAAAQASSALAASPIPPVKNPRDITTLARRPCELLTAKQAKEFNLDLPPRQYNAGLGDLGCEWETTSHNQDLVRKVQIDTFTNNPTLEVAYSKDRNLPFLS
jgi:Protein of unknown function (DUF3558)